jgi:DNA ligase-1
MFKFPTIYKKTKGGKVQEWTVLVEGDSYKTISGQTDGLKVESEFTVCYAKNVGKQNETTAEEQAVKEAQALYTKKIEGGYHQSIDDIEQKKFFEPMLAKDFLDYKDDIQYPVHSQPKLDGVRCIVNKDGMWTRNGKQIISAPHIRNSLQPLFDAQPELVFDGELYNHDLKHDFNTIVSLIKKTKPTAEDLKESAEKIQYHIYDLPSREETFQFRLKSLASYWYNNLMPDCCVLVRTDVAVNMAAIERLYGEYVDDGYEGQMIRINKPYENKRSKYLLKHKTFQDQEFKILDIVEGEGNRTGTAGYMVFEIAGQRFKSNIKGEFEYLQRILQERDLLIGKTATIKYFNLTPAGIPRFPYVTKINREEYE